MIVKPVLIVGSPRSGTSMLQKIVRECPGFYSLPSESNEIWDIFCHPSLRGWESEVVPVSALTDADRTRILRLFDQNVWSAAFWRRVGKQELIWSFRRSPWQRKLIRVLYLTAMEAIRMGRSPRRRRRLVEKTASNCYRLGYVNAVFGDAKILHITRDGRNAVNSIINGWRHPKRFFSYDVPGEIRMPGYEHNRWNFTLPPAWRDYLTRPLEQICAWQWTSANQCVLDECAKPEYDGRVLRVKLEDLQTQTPRELRRLANFLELPFDRYFEDVARELPVVNSPDNETDPDKWRGQNREMIERIIPQITPMMTRLDYGL